MPERFETSNVTIPQFLLGFDPPAQRFRVEVGKEGTLAHLHTTLNKSRDEKLVERHVRPRDRRTIRKKNGKDCNFAAT